jgi:hypothetical protein
LRLRASKAIAAGDEPLMLGACIEPMPIKATVRRRSHSTHAAYATKIWRHLSPAFCVRDPAGTTPGNPHA